MAVIAIRQNGLPGSINAPTLVATGTILQVAIVAGAGLIFGKKAAIITGGVFVGAGIAALLLMRFARS